MGLIEDVALKPFIKKTIYLIFITFHVQSHVIPRSGNNLESEIHSKLPVSRDLYYN